MKLALSVLFVAFWLAGCNMRVDDPLIGAARSGDTPTLKTLLAGSADPNRRWGVNDWTPLMHAIHKNQKASLEVLVDAVADMNARCGDGVTALMMAAGYGYADIVKVLLDHGADVHAETSGGDNALTMAVGGVPDIDKFTVGKCQTATVDVLLKKAPDLKMKDSAYARAARLAARAAGCTDVLSLIAHGV
jgi:ankyrin repeat protein